jgi:hypothetical protein
VLRLAAQHVVWPVPFVRLEMLPGLGAPAGLANGRSWHGGNSQSRLGKTVWMAHCQDAAVRSDALGARCQVWLRPMGESGMTSSRSGCIGSGYWRSLSQTK